MLFEGYSKHSVVSRMKAYGFSQELVSINSKSFINNERKMFLDTRTAHTPQKQLIYISQQHIRTIYNTHTLDTHHTHTYTAQISHTHQDTHHT